MWQNNCMLLVLFALKKILVTSLKKNTSQNIKESGEELEPVPWRELKTDYILLDTRIKISYVVKVYPTWWLKIQNNGNCAFWK